MATSNTPNNTESAQNDRSSDSDLTIIGCLHQRAITHKNGHALQFKENQKWINYRWADVYGLVEKVSATLKEMGTEKNDKIVIMSETRPEWMIADLAIMSTGAITVPVYPNILPNEIEFIINNSEAKILFLENDQVYQKWLSIKGNCPSVKEVVLFKSGQQSVKDYVSWIEMLNRGRDFLLTRPKLFTDLIKAIKPFDYATIVYTSGTTGLPKGVVLSHKQIMSEVQDAFKVLNVDERDVSLTFLPFSHIFGRVESWGSVFQGYKLAFAENIESIKSNIGEVRPTFLVAVPRIFEKIYAGILAQLENSKTKQRLFSSARKVGLEVSDRLQKKQTISPILYIKYEAARNLIFKKIMASLGGRLRFAVSGGAPLSPEIAKFFHALGLLICEGYGLTETTAGITFNTTVDYKFGSVGRPLGDVKLKIAEDGEILVKSDKVMVGYYKNEEATDGVFKDGYFCTGDIGHIDDDNFLFITDRKKDLIKTAGGKYVAPQKLENILKTSPYISNVLIHGDQKKYIIALITLNAKYADRTNDPDMYKIIKDVVADANTQLSSFESIKKFSILPSDFTIETGELTPSLKVKRRFCDQKFKKEIDELY